MSDQTQLTAEQLAAAALKPQSMANDGVSVSNRSFQDLISAKKFLDANANVLGLASGQLGFPGVKIGSPSPGGGHVDDYC